MTSTWLVVPLCFSLPCSSLFAINQLAAGSMSYTQVLFDTIGESLFPLEEYFIQTDF